MKINYKINVKYTTVDENHCIKLFRSINDLRIVANVPWHVNNRYTLHYDLNVQTLSMLVSHLLREIQ